MVWYWYYGCGWLCGGCVVFQVCLVVGVCLDDYWFDFLVVDLNWFGCVELQLVVVQVDDMLLDVIDLVWIQVDVYFMG